MGSHETQFSKSAEQRVRKMDRRATQVFDEISDGLNSGLTAAELVDIYGGFDHLEREIGQGLTESLKRRVEIENQANLEDITTERVSAIESSAEVIVKLQMSLRDQIPRHLAVFLTKLRNTHMRNLSAEDYVRAEKRAIEIYELDTIRGLDKE